MNTDKQTTLTRRLMLAAPAAALALPAEGGAQNSTDAAWAVWSDAHPKMLASRDAWEAAITGYRASNGPFRLEVEPFIKVDGHALFTRGCIDDLGRGDADGLNRQLAEHTAAWNAEHRRTGIAAIRDEWYRQGERAAESAQAITDAPISTPTDAARKLRVELCYLSHTGYDLEPYEAVIAYLGGTE